MFKRICQINLVITKFCTTYFEKVYVEFDLTLTTLTPSLERLVIMGTSFVSVVGICACCTSFVKFSSVMPASCKTA